MSNILLSSDRLKEIFNTAQTQADILVSIYKEVFSNWDNIEKIDGWPICNKETWTWIYHRMRTFDDVVTNPRLKELGKLYVMPGGLWFNSGFSVNDPLAETLQLFEVIPCTVTLKENKEAVCS